MSDRIRVADAARLDYSSAHNCAESVLRAVSAEAELSAVHEALGSGFTSGIGNSGCVCGALVGGVMVLGAYVQTEDLQPEAQRLRAEELSAELYERFKERWGATCCRVIKRGMQPGSRESATRCADIAEFSAALAMEIIDEARGGVAKRFGPRDVTAVTQRLAIGGLAGVALGLAAALVVGLFGYAIAWPVSAGAVVGLGVAGAGETGGHAARRAVRVLGAIGVAAGALAAFVAVFGGQHATDVLASVRSDGLAPLIVGIGLLALAVVRGYEVVRFR